MLEAIEIYFNTHYGEWCTAQYSTYIWYVVCININSMNSNSQLYLNLRLLLPKRIIFQTLNKYMYVLVHTCIYIIHITSFVQIKVVEGWTLTLFKYHLNWNFMKTFYSRCVVGVCMCTNFLFIHFFFFFTSSFSKTVFWVWFRCCFPRHFWVLLSTLDLSYSSFICFVSTLFRSQYTHMKM